jgi:hypothetical protein
MRILYDFLIHESTQISISGRGVKKAGDIAQAKEHGRRNLDSDSSSEWVNHIKTHPNKK